MKHDENYRRMFTHLPVVEALITRYVDADLARALRFEQAQREETNFVRPGDLAKRESDVLWRIPHASGEDVYVYVLLEFQSTQDDTMALRVLQYVTLLWERLITQDEALVTQRRLPPIYPLVLYNGKPRWNAATDVHSLIIEPMRSVRADRIAQVRYDLIDIGHWEEPEMIEEGVDPASLIMRFERARSPEEFRELIEVAIEALGVDEVLRPVSKTIAVWLAHLAQHREYVGEVDMTELEQADESEAMTLLESRMEQWKRDAEREKERMLREGREEGREEGLRKALAKLLQVRFGDHPKRTERLDALGEDELEHALIRILDAAREEDVFAP